MKFQSLLDIKCLLNLSVSGIISLKANLASTSDLEKLQNEVEQSSSCYFNNTYFSIHQPST